MMHDNNDPLNESRSQFVLSHELLYLLRWLADHDAQKLQKIVSKALASGLKDELRAIDRTPSAQTTEDIHHSIIDFFSLLESLLANAITQQAQQTAKEQKLMPSVDQIDITICDDHTVRSSLEKVSSRIDLNPQANAKEMLFEEILKRWKPINNNIS